MKEKKKYKHKDLTFAEAIKCYLFIGVCDCCFIDLFTIRVNYLRLFIIGYLYYSTNYKLIRIIAL
jgi:hypothetical protein